jgi:hypothetical protein
MNIYTKRDEDGDEDDMHRILKAGSCRWPRTHDSTGIKTIIVTGVIAVVFRVSARRFMWDWTGLVADPLVD